MKIHGLSMLLIVLFLTGMLLPHPAEAIGLMPYEMEIPGNSGGSCIH